MMPKVENKLCLLTIAIVLLDLADLQAPKWKTFLYLSPKQDKSGKVPTSCQWPHRPHPLPRSNKFIAEDCQACWCGFLPPSETFVKASERISPLCKLFWSLIWSVTSLRGLDKHWECRALFLTGLSSPNFAFISTFCKGTTVIPPFQKSESGSVFFQSPIECVLCW